MFHVQLDDIQDDMRYLILGSEDILADFQSQEYGFGEEIEEEEQTVEEEDWEMQAWEQVYAEL